MPWILFPAATLIAAPIAVPVPTQFVARNLRLAGHACSQLFPQEPGRAFLVDEQGQGASDLNADGDVEDGVLHLWPQSQGSLHNAGLAGGPVCPSFAGRTAALAVSESHQGAADLNGDGDLLDDVLVLVHDAGGAVINLGLAVQPFTVRLSDRMVAFAVSENAQGGVDLNGDGDALDHVLHYVATSGGPVINVGLAVHLEAFSPGIEIEGASLVVKVSEIGQSQDLDGDGMLDDFVPHVIDLAQGNLFVLPASSNLWVAASAGHVASWSRESIVAADLNGDGDQADLVLQVLHVASGTTTNTGLEGDADLRADGPYLAFGAFESVAGSDLNGDGDQIDRVAQLLHLPTASATNTGLAIGVLSGLRGRWLAVHVAEGLQGAQDLNGDGDASDHVLHVVDVSDGSATNLGRQVAYSTPGERLVTYQVRETLQGGSDLNGDGDIADCVWHAYDTATGANLNLGLATPCLGWQQTSGVDWILFTAFEASSGAQDLNGDGDAQDSVLFLLRSADGAAVNLGLAAGPLGVSGRRVSLLVDESAQGGVDLNGDGDAADLVVHLLDV